jgi:non-ribosomal peptide synthetase component F
MPAATDSDVTRADIDGLPPVIGRLLRARAAGLGDKKFLACDTGTLTYAEADRRSARLARGLLAVGAGKGTHVGLLSRSPRWPPPASAPSRSRCPPCPPRTSCGDCCAAATCASC